MGTPTARLGLLRPAGTDIVELISQINDNFDKIDKWAGVILTPAGIKPANSALFDGAIVKEQVSDWVWVAEYNGSGYNKKYIGQAIQWDHAVLAGAITNVAQTVYDSGLIPAVDYDRLLILSVTLGSVALAGGAGYMQANVITGGVSKLVVRNDQTGTVNAVANVIRLLVQANTTYQFVVNVNVNVGTGTLTSDVRYNNVSYSLEPVKS